MVGLDNGPVSSTAQCTPMRFLKLFSVDEVEVTKEISIMFYLWNTAANLAKCRQPLSSFVWNKNVLHTFRLQISKAKLQINCNLKTPRKNIYFNQKTKTRLKVLACSSIFINVCISKAACKQAQSFPDNVNSKYSNILKEKEENANFDFKTLLKVLKPHIFQLFIAIGCCIVVALMNVKIPLLLGDLINCLKDMSTCQTNVDYLSIIKLPAKKLIASYIIQGFFTFGFITTLSSVGESLAQQLRSELFSNIIRQDISFFDSHKTHEIMSRLTSDIQEFKSSFKLCVGQGLKAVIQTGGCIVSLYMLSHKLTAFLLILVPGIVCIGTILGSSLRCLSKKCQAQVAKSSDIAGEAIGNVRTVRAFAMEDKEDSLYFDEVNLTARLNFKLGAYIGMFQGLSTIALNGIILSVIGVGGFLMSTEQFGAGDLMSFLVATQTIQRSLMQMSILFGTSVRGMTAAGRIFEYMNSVADIPVVGGIIIPNDELKGNIEFNNVIFSYPTRPKQVILKKLNLSVKSGNVIAICGTSGAGKSTVASLLERFYDVDGGCIKLDGYDISLLNPSWLRGKVLGFISQEPILFATSIIENIRYGKPDATDEEVHEAARRANADMFIQSFPNGYKTVVGERGVTLSGGQKQRIAIARALIRNPSVLILDEATSALDAESEKLVQDALEKVTKGRTVIVIAHRLSTIQNADIIAVLCNGVIAESGTHAGLVKKKGLYWQLIQQQQQQSEQPTDNLMSDMDDGSASDETESDYDINEDNDDGVTSKDPVRNENNVKQLSVIEVKLRMAKLAQILMDRLKIHIIVLITSSSIT
ncbi:ATP-binding cassette sub-family B member 8, mitochondrial [Nymphon striatum]|nr:ATP-binding cassette sub-family B member 8, mitochondrial [Nymphon striatum]